MSVGLGAAIELHHQSGHMRPKPGADHQSESILYLHKLMPSFKAVCICRLN